MDFNKAENMVLVLSIVMTILLNYLNAYIIPNFLVAKGQKSPPFIKGVGGVIAFFL